LAQQLREANARAALDRPSAELRAGNLPLVILESSRAQTEQVLAIDSSTRELALWIEVAPGSRSFAVEVATADDRPVQQAGRLKANRYGALAIVLPAGKLPPGHYVVRLFGEDPRQLLGQYLLRITAE
jgi:hypothetical protein